MNAEKNITNAQILSIPIADSDTALVNISEKDIRLLREDCVRSGDDERTVRPRKIPTATEDMRDIA